MLIAHEYNRRVEDRTRAACDVKVGAGDGDGPRQRREPAGVTCRDWLRENGHRDTAELIDEVMQEWRAAGKRTRRDWWLILAGNKKGGGRVVAGRTFPVLPEAIDRKLGISADRSHVTVPPVRSSNRWPKAAGATPGES